MVPDYADSIWSRRIPLKLHALSVVSAVDYVVLVLHKPAKARIPLGSTRYDSTTAKVLVPNLGVNYPNWAMEIFDLGNEIGVVKEEIVAHLEWLSRKLTEYFPDLDISNSSGVKIHLRMMRTPSVTTNFQQRKNSAPLKLWLYGALQNMFIVIIIIIIIIIIINHYQSERGFEKNFNRCAWRSYG